MALQHRQGRALAPFLLCAEAEGPHPVVPTAHGEELFVGADLDVGGAGAGEGQAGLLLEAVLFYSCVCVVMVGVEVGIHAHKRTIQSSPSNQRIDMRP